MVAAPLLAAADPDRPDLAPVRLAAVVAGHTGAPLRIASVYANDDVVGALAGGALGEDLPADAGEILDVARGAVGEVPGGVDVLPLGATSAPRGLAFAAEELGAGLIVVGGPGSTAGRLLSGAPCAVAVVPRTWEPVASLSTVGAAFVDTAEGRAALDAASALARRAGAALRVLVGVQRHAWMSASIDDVRVRAEEAAGAAVGDVVGVRVDIDVAVGEPAELLVAASAELDVLVCGARGYGPVPATLLGGVTCRVTTEAACPVIVLARGAAVRLEDLVADGG